MKTNFFLAVIAVVFLVGFVSSCTKTDTAETETLYEAQSVDRTKVRIPGQQ